MPYIRAFPIEDLHDILEVENLGLLHFPGIYLEEASIRWSQAGARGLQRPGVAAWSGHANDVLRTPNAIVIASQSGGVWIQQQNGGLPRNISNSWGQPDVNCLLQGRSEFHLVAAGFGIYVADWTTGTLDSWNSVPLPDGVSQVYRSAYLPDHDVVVLANDLGVHYAVWPAAPSDPWKWSRVGLLQPGRFSDVIAGPEGTVVAAYWGVNLTNGFYGIVVLEFAGSELVVATRASITNADETKMTMVSLTSCQRNPQRMYAAAAGAGDGAANLLAVLRSDDGGRNCIKAGDSVTTALNYPHNLLNATGNQGNGWNNCIECSPVNPDVVLLGWRTAGPFVSTDGAATWQLKHDDTDTPDLHSDLHAVRFDRNDPAGQRFFVASDGGVVATADLGTTLSSSLNTNLADLQFQSMPARQFDGYFHASPANYGLVAGGLQDNGVAWSNVAQNQPWKMLVGGDGYRAVFLKTGQLLFTSNGLPAPQMCDWNGGDFINQRVVPVGVAKPGLPGNSGGLYDVFGNDDAWFLIGLPKRWYRNTIIAPVPEPSFTNAPNHTMFALGSVYGDVYGLFAASDGSTDAQWDYVGSVPIDTNQYEIRSLSAFHGENIYVGTSDGRIFALDPKQQSALELSVPPLMDITPITRILTVDSSDRAYAIHGNDLLQLEGFGWVKLGGLPNEPLYSIACHNAQHGQILYVCTDSRVFASHDQGASWRLASSGLPERSHCGDLAIGIGSGSTPVMYLSTFGRSVWSTALPA